MKKLIVDYIVRWEWGTISRFIYSIAMLAPADKEQVVLENIFPDGVCDFSRADVGLPPGW